MRVYGTERSDMRRLIRLYYIIHFDAGLIQLRKNVAIAAYMLFVIRCPHSTRCSFNIMVGCPSVRLSRRSTCRLPQPGREQQISIESWRRPSSGCGWAAVSVMLRAEVRGSTQTCFDVCSGTTSVCVSSFQTRFSFGTF